VTSEIIAALIGAGIALVGGIVGAFLQHFLSLRTDRIKRERDRQEEEARSKQDGREERVRWLREKQNKVDKREEDSREREIDRLREVLLGSVSSRLAPQDLEKFMEEVEKKYHEDGWKWAERPPEALETWLRQRLQEAGEEWNSQEETQDEPLE
jgi:predicted Holliday junction resolvase-like endonuclease